MGTKIEIFPNRSCRCGCVFYQDLEIDWCSYYKKRIRNPNNSEFCKILRILVEESDERRDEK